MKLATTALVLSTAEYACPVWAHSTHIKKLDTVINQAFRLISGAIKPTPTSMLPVISGIAPPTLRRDYQILKLHQKSLEPRSLVPHTEADTAPARLNRECFATRAENLNRSHPLHDNWLLDKWSQVWTQANTHLHQFIPIPSMKPPGFELGRHALVKLNRLRTGWALTGSFQNRIGALQSAACVCGEVQDVRHIIEDCPYLSPPNGLNGLIQLDDDTIEWLYRTDIDL